MNVFPVCWILRCSQGPGTCPPSWTTFCHSFSHFFRGRALSSYSLSGRTEEKMVFRVLQLWNAQGLGFIQCQSGSPLKESFVSPSSWFYVVTFPLTTLFSILNVSRSVMSVSDVCKQQSNLMCMSHLRLKQYNVGLWKQTLPALRPKTFPSQSISNTCQMATITSVCVDGDHFTKARHLTTNCTLLRPL